MFEFRLVMSRICLSVDWSQSVKTMSCDIAEHTFLLNYLISNYSFISAFLVFNLE